MADIINAKADFVKFLVRANDLNTGELNITKMFVHKAEVNEPYVTDVTTLVDAEELVATSFKISDSNLVVHAEKSLQDPFEYNRCYITNSSDEIIYIFDIATEIQSEIEVDLQIKLQDIVEIVV